MALHFTEQEFADRRAAAVRSMVARDLDGLLIFRQESMFYLTGYDTFGYCFFQCMLLSADGHFSLLTRAPDLRQAQHTSVIEDIRIWTDGHGVNPAHAVRELLAEYGLRGRKLGVEYGAYGLNAQHGRMLDTALDEFCLLEDASDLVGQLRLVKSTTELDYVRRAAELADDALEAAVELTRAGAYEGEILAAMQAAVFRGGGDYAGNEFIIGSGRDALLCRYFSGRRHLGEQDQLTLEFAGVYRHYHACLMRTLLVGRAGSQHRLMFNACAAAMHACVEKIRPSHTMGEVFDAHARILDEAGFKQHRMNACGYSLGATFAPTWMDPPMFYANNPTKLKPNMVFFLHMILANSDTGKAMTLGQTVRVTSQGSESFTRLPMELIVK